MAGVERWGPKTLSDPDAAKVDTFNIVDTSVSLLVALPAPPHRPQNGRIAPTELTVYRVTAGLVEARHETDGDIHVVIEDPTTHETMIIEMPDDVNSALALNPLHGAAMKAVRDEFRARFAVVPHTLGGALTFTPITGTATITGPALFDQPHGQRGVARNAVQIHPVLGLEFSDKARAVGTPVS